MIHVSELKPNEPVYNWVADDGSNIKIASTRLRNWCLLNRHILEIYLFPVDFELGKSWIKDGQCDPARVANLTWKERREPIIICKRKTFTDGRPDVLVVDGHHRYARNALEQDPFIEGWFLELDQWTPFEIEGSITITKEQLAAAPLMNYGSIKK